jgi:hypothetical protein
MFVGAFRSTRVENLFCEAGSSTLEHRRLLITAKAAIRFMATNEHPIKKKLDDPTIYDQKTKNFHIRAMDTAATLDINYQKIRQLFRSLHPPWMLNQKRFDTEMLKYASNENNYVKKSAFMELVDLTASIDTTNIYTRTARKWTERLDMLLSLVERNSESATAR